MPLPLTAGATTVTTTYPVWCLCCCCFDPAFEGDLIVEYTAGVVPGLENEAIGLNGLTSRLGYVGQSASGRAWSYDAVIGQSPFYFDYLPGTPHRKYLTILSYLFCSGAGVGLYQMIRNLGPALSCFGCVDWLAGTYNDRPYDPVTVGSCDPVLISGDLVIPPGAAMAPCYQVPFCKPGYTYQVQATITPA